MLMVEKLRPKFETLEEISIGGMCPFFITLGLNFMFKQL